MKTIIKYILFFAWTISSCKISFAQNENLDSLKLLLKTTKADTLKIRLVAEIGEAENIVRIGYWDSIANSAQKLNVLATKAFALNNIGYIYLNKGDVSNGLNYFIRSLKLSEEINYTFGAANALNNIGIVYDWQGDYNNALEYYNKSLAILEKNSDVTLMATVLNNIAGIYNTHHDYDNALNYYKRSLMIRKRINNKEGIANSLNNIGNVYFILSETSDKNENIEKALSYVSQSLSVSEEIDDKYEAAYSLNKLSEIWFKKGDLQKALVYAQHAMKDAQELNYPESISETAERLEKIYQKQNKYKDAFEMYHLYIKMRDSINNEEVKKSAIKQQMKYEYEKKESADSVRVAKEKEVVAVQLKQEKTQRYALYGGLILTVVFGGFMLNRFLITQKQKKIIEEQKSMVEKQKELVENKQKEILDSIHYAKRIQQSLLPHEKYIDKNLKRLTKDKT